MICTPDSCFKYSDFRCFALGLFLCLNFVQHFLRRLNSLGFAQVKHSWWDTQCNRPVRVFLDLFFAHILGTGYLMSSHFSVDDTWLIPLTHANINLALELRHDSLLKATLTLQCFII